MKSELEDKVDSTPSSASVRTDLPESVHTTRRRLLIATGVMGGCGLVGTAVPFLASMEPSERARALGAPIEVQLAPLRPGELHTESWRGRPVWILKRTPEMLSAIQ